MLRDAEHFRNRIGGLDGAGDAGDYLVKLVGAKSIPKPKPTALQESEIAKHGATYGKTGTKDSTDDDTTEQVESK